MIPYWLLFAYFAIGAIITRTALRAAPLAVAASRNGTQAVPTRPRPEIPSRSLLTFGFGIIILMAGLRYRVGGDWGSYALIFLQTSQLPYSSAVELLDPGYQTVAWMCAQLGAGVWLVNIICATIFCWGLYRLVRQQPSPWLAAAVAIPYLVIVVAMGYTRQAAAIGLLMAGIASLIERGSALRFLVFAIVATLFHKTAFILIPVVLFGSGRSRLAITVLVVATVGVLFQYLLAGELPRLTRDYIDAGYESNGAAIRIAMTSVCGLIFLMFRKRMLFLPIELVIWRNFAIAAFGLYASLFLISSSTVIDRVGLYLFPLQVVVLNRVPVLLNNDIAGKIAVLLFSVVVLFVWSNYGDNSFYWNPYRMVPLSVLGFTA